MELFFHIDAGPPAVGVLPFAGAIYTAANLVFKRRRLVRPCSLVDGQAPRVSRREVAPRNHIALARKPSLNASGLLLWARATS